MTFLTHRKHTLLNLPIVLSERAWLETVYINDFLVTELNTRLLTVIKRAYRELMAQPDYEENNCMSFDLTLYPASGERTHLVSLDLCLVIDRQHGELHLLRIMLKHEMPAVNAQTSGSAD